MYNVMRALRTIKTPKFGVVYTAIVALFAIIALSLVIAGCDFGANWGGGSTGKVAAGGACTVDSECARLLLCNSGVCE